MKPHRLLLLTVAFLTACGGEIERVDPTPKPAASTPAYVNPLGGTLTPRPAASPASSSGSWMWEKRTLDGPNSSSGKKSK